MSGWMVCTNANPPQSCFWVTISCFDGPQARSIFARSTVIPLAGQAAIADEHRRRNARGVSPASAWGVAKSARHRYAMRVSVYAMRVSVEVDC